MLVSHTVIHLFAIRKGLQAYPANMRSTSRAGHIVTAECLFNHYATIRTIPNTKLLLSRGAL
jgi:hypothetical protein